MILFVLLGFIPAIFLVKLGRSRRPAPENPESQAGWAGFLAVAMGALLAAAFLPQLIFGDMGSLLVLILLPSICALLAEIILYAVELLTHFVSGGAGPYLRRPAALLLIVPILLAALGLAADRSLLLIILAGGGLLASGWLLWGRIGKGLALSYPLLLFLLLAVVWVTDTQSEYEFLPVGLVPLARFLVGVAPGLGIVFSVRLVGWALSSERSQAARRWSLAAVLAVPVLLLLAWQAATASAWDVATDGLGGIFMLELAFVVGVAAAAGQSLRLPPRPQPFLFGYAALIVAVVLAANGFGTYGFDGAWGNVPRARTERRAEVVRQAVLRYHAREGQYPQELADLTPATLLYLPRPFMIPHQDWCYQGGADFYRLGYVYREYFSTPASVKVYAAEGRPEDPAWPCDAEAAKYPAPGG